MALTDGKTRFHIHGITGAVPEGLEGGHVRTSHLFLGYNEGESEISWLSMSAPTVTRIRAPGSDFTHESAPFDILAQLNEREVPMEQLGEVTVDGVRAPVVVITGVLDLCARVGDCRTNTRELRIYVLVPYSGGTLVVETAPERRLGRPRDRDPGRVDAFLADLQAWADTIDLP